MLPSTLTANRFGRTTVATKHSIAPFPADIDRAYFGAWLSGFTDGEGYFRLGFDNGLPVARFSVCLRSDDVPVLHLIRSFLQCGSPVYDHKKVYGRKNRPTSINESPTSTYVVKDIESLHNVIVPHFTVYPLLAKKSNDFSIWSEAVVFLYVRSTIIRYDTRGRRHTGYHSWSSAQLHKFSTYVERLKEVRQFTREST